MFTLSQVIRQVEVRLEKDQHGPGMLLVAQADGVRVELDLSDPKAMGSYYNSPADPELALELRKLVVEQLLNAYDLNDWHRDQKLSRLLLDEV